RTEQRRLIALFEFVRGFLKGYEIANAIIAGRPAKDLRRGDRHEHGVAASTSSGHEDGAGICEAGRRRKARRANRILHVGDAPIPPKPFPIGPPVARAARIVEIEPGEAAGGKEHCPRFESARGGAGWSAMKAYDQRRRRSGALSGRVFRLVKKGM